MFYDRLQELCKEHGIALTTVVVDILGMSRGNLSRWKNGAIPKSDTLSALSEYFKVSTDYLLGTAPIKENDKIESDDTSLILTKDEKWFILKLRELDREGRTVVESTLISEIRRLDSSKEDTINVG